MKKLVGLMTAMLFLFASASAFACGDDGGDDDSKNLQQVTSQLAPGIPTIACDGDGGDDDS